MTYQAGVEALAQVGAFFDIEPAPDGAAHAGVERSDFEAALDRLASSGAPTVEDRGAAWEAFSAGRSEWTAVAHGL